MHSVMTSLALGDWDGVRKQDVALWFCHGWQSVVLQAFSDALKRPRPVPLFRL
jgi:hypothetical protein